MRQSLLFNFYKRKQYAQKDIIKNLYNMYKLHKKMIDKRLNIRYGKGENKQESSEISSRNNRIKTGGKKDGKKID